jgi:polyisoprenoid-binding protein YceI
MTIQAKWHRTKWILFLLLTAVLLMACGADETQTAVSPSPTVVTEPATAAEPDPLPPATEPTATVAAAEPEETAISDEPPAAETSEPEAEAVGDGLRFRIDPARSEARFIIDEVLRGNPFTVVGTTSAVEGDLLVDLDNPAQTEVGEISVDASTLVTDESLRNRAIYNFILNTSTHQFVRFTPTNLLGLPQTAVAIGETVEFQIEGELTIRTITQPVTFEAVVTIISDTEISGQATTIIQRDDFDLSIPRVPQVASVDEELTLEIEFVAVNDS